MLLLTVALPQARAASAGLKPSEAPLVTVGQHYFGDVYRGTPGCCRTTDLWRLPLLLTSDVVTVAWTATSEWPTTLCLSQEIDDYNWAEDGKLCNGSDRYDASDSGSARTIISVRSATPSAYLEFSGCACFESSQPYDFVIESIQHAIGVGLNPAKRISPDGMLTGTANLSDGSPVPDGLVFTLLATWTGPNHSEHHRAYSATSSGGSLAFSLNLPRSAQEQTVTFSVTRPADSQYEEAASSTVELQVGKFPRGIAFAQPRVPVRHSKALVRLICKGNGPCRGVIRLVARFRRGRHISRTMIGKTQFSVPADQVEVARIRLSRKGRVLLRRARRHHLIARLRGQGIKNRRIVMTAGIRHGERHHRRR